MSERRPAIAYVTAGAGGMYCGSCLHDNTLAKALIRQGIDAHLIPTYTPIRTDEENVSDGRVFLGGINVYLSQRLPGYRFLPAWSTRLFDRPWLLRWVARQAAATDARALGALTVSMLRGTAGAQRREVELFCDWLCHDVRPDLVVLSNMLIAGCVPRLKEKLGVPVLVTLQGDDIFLDSLPEPYKQQSLVELGRLARSVDGFLVNSQYYADFMCVFAGLPRKKMRLVPLGIDVTGFPSPSHVETESGRDRPRTIGYLARLAPEKGLHVLVDAFVELRRRHTMRDVQLKIAGWLGEGRRAYVAEQQERLRAAGLEQDVTWAGELDRPGKIAFLRELDVLSVPTTYREPKGLFVLEALAAGVPVVQPAHGAFPELLQATGGGVLVPPHDAQKLADALENLLADETRRRMLARTGQRAVHERYHAAAMAEANWQVMRNFVRAW